MPEYIFGIFRDSDFEPLGLLQFKLGFKRALHLDENLGVVEEILFDDLPNRLLLTVTEFGGAGRGNQSFRLRRTGFCEGSWSVFRLPANYEESSEQKQCRHRQIKDFALS
jgi:hypothetical protein